MDWEERTLTIPGLEVAAKMWGDPRGRPVLAVHGWLDNAASFDALAPLLGQTFYIAAVDLPGHGRSEGRGEGEAYHFVDWVGVVLQIVDALGWDSFSILGHSMGAAIAALTEPAADGRVERMVLLDGLGPWSHPPEEVVDQLVKGLAQEELLRHKGRRRYDSVDAMIEALGESRSDVSQERLRLLVKRVARREKDGRWYFGHDRKLQAASRIRLTESQVMAFLEAISCPVFLVRPRWGWPVDEEIIERRVEAIDDLEIEQVEGGHHVHLEAPERLSDAVSRFLDHD